MVRNAVNEILTLFDGKPQATARRTIENTGACGLPLNEAGRRSR